MVSLKLVCYLIVVLGALFAFPALAQEVEEASISSIFDLIGTFIVLATMVVIIWRTRVLVKRKVQRLMIVKSQAQESDALPEVQAEEVQATRTPEFVVVDMNSDRETAIAARKVAENRARSLVRLTFRYDLLATIGYILIPIVPNFLPGADSDLVTGYQVAGPLIAVLFGFLTVVRRIVYGWEFQAHKSFRAQMVRLVSEGLLLHPVQMSRPDRRPYVAAAVIGGAVLTSIFAWLSSFWLHALGLQLAAAFHLVLMARLMTVIRGTPNLKLVVLRVFGIDEMATFTFEGLLNYWKLFGSFFTVVDPSFLTSDYRQRMWSPAFLVLAFFVIASLEALVLESTESSTLLTLFVFLAAVLPVTLALGAVYAHLSLQRVERGFVRSLDDLVARLRRLDARPRALDLSFKNVPMMCYDDTWKIAVSECVKIASAILMDLRGFSEERKGCEYEVGYLLDSIPIEQVVFLVDPPGVSQVEKLILERWRFMRATSPNLKVAVPKVCIYVSSKKNEEDIQGILDALLSVANTPRAA